MRAPGASDEADVKPAADPQDREVRQGAQRLVVMWVCWIVLAAFLLVAGVCALS